MKVKKVEREQRRYSEWRMGVQGLFFNASQAVFARRRYIFQIAVIVAAAGFAVLTFLAKQIAYFSFDLKITLFVQRVQNPIFDAVMRFLTYLGGPNNVPIITLIAASVLLAMFKKFREIVFLVIITVGSFFIAQFMKSYVGRIRPDANLINQVSTFVRNDSFPSGHVMYFVGFYGFLTFLTFTLLKKGYLKRVLMTLFLLGILFIGPSRIYLGAHWFSDTLGAYLLGFVWLSVVISAYIAFKPKVKSPEKT